MRKKMALRVCAVVSMAMFALPAVAPAQEIHVEPGNGEAFTFSSPGGEVKVEGEPTVTCEMTSGSGAFDVGSSTTGSMERDYLGCHIKVPVFGTTAKCHSEGSPVDNTVRTTGTFHLITWENAKSEGFPGMLMTTDTARAICAGISSMTFTGSLIGTITSPRCGESGKELKLSFTATGAAQDHLTYTGNSYDLKAYTGMEAANEKTAAMVGTAIATSANAQKLNCT